MSHCVPRRLAISAVQRRSSRRPAEQIGEGRDGIGIAEHAQRLDRVR